MSAEGSADMPPFSPKILRLSWGRIEIEGGQEFKDVKLYPSGARAWDWRETGTSHSRGISRGDVEELLEHGAKVIVLSRGMNGRLLVSPEALDLLEDLGLPAHVHRTEEAAQVYNRLCEAELVGGLFHSTC